MMQTEERLCSNALMNNELDNQRNSLSIDLMESSMYNALHKYIEINIELYYSYM